MTSDSPALPDPVRADVAAWIEAHDEWAPGLVEGLYVVGSLALGDWRPGSDVDVVVFTAEPATDEDAASLRAAHQVAARGTTAPIDGPRLAWGDVTVPPQPLHRPWSLEGEFHHDGECFEINPVTWFTLATRGLVVIGPPVADLDVSLDADRRRAFVRENTDTYWRSVADRIEAALADPGPTEFEAGVTEWCVLGAARMLYTWTTADVASKTDAGAWLADELPMHAEVVSRALQTRARPATTEPHDRAVVREVLALVRDVVVRVSGRSQRADRGGRMPP